VGEPNHALRAARERTGSGRAPGEPLSRVELAEQVNAWLWGTTGRRYDLDHHLIGKWERGVVARPIDPYRAALKAVLGADRDADLGFGDVVRRTGGTSDNAAGPWRRSSIVADVGEAARQDVMTRRNTVHEAAAPGGAGLLAPLAGWLEPLVDSATSRSSLRRGGFAAPEVIALEHLTAEFRQWRSTGAALGRSAVVGQLADVVDRLRDAPTGPLTDRVLLVAAELSRTAGSMSYDDGLQSTAQRHYLGAVQLAKAGGHDDFGGFGLAALSRLLLDAGRAADALEVVAIAQRGTRRTGTPGLRSMLATRQAWGHAQRGESYAFDDAETAHADIAPAVEPHWLHSFDRAELHGTIGARYRDLAQHDERQARHAVTYLGRALVERDPARTRNRAFDLVSLARVHLLTGEHDRAADTVRGALPLLDPARPGRLARKLADWHREATPHSAAATVRAAREEISTLLPRSA
jgi:hypothetical protein